MENIFENAYFGKLYKTRDDIKCLYIGPSIDKKRHFLILESNKDIYDFDTNGHRECGDIEDIEEWREPIDEEKLDELTQTEMNMFLNINTGEMHYCTETEKEAFKIGYRKAYEQYNKRHLWVGTQSPRGLA